MPLSPSGVYTLPNGYLAVTGQDILPSQHNPPLEDIAAVLSEAFYRTGVAPMLAALNMNTFKITGLGNGTAATDAVNKSQLDGAVTFPNASSFVFDAGDKMVQFGSTGVNTDGFGGAIINFGVTFSSPPSVVLACNGNASFYSGGINIFPGYTTAGFAISTNPPILSSGVLVNWVAIGAKT